MSKLDFYKAAVAEVGPNRGIVGLIAEENKKEVMLQFGASGPFYTYSRKNVRHATNEERKKLEGIL